MTEPSRGPGIQQVLINYKEPSFSLSLSPVFLLGLHNKTHVEPWMWSTSLLSTSNSSTSSPHPGTVVLQVWSPDQQLQHELRTDEKQKFSGPTPDLLKQKFWRGQQSLVISLPDDSGICSGFRTSDLEQSPVWHCSVSQTSFLPLTVLAFSDPFTLTKVYSLPPLTFPIGFYPPVMSCSL